MANSAEQEHKGIVEVLRKYQQERIEIKQEIAMVRTSFDKGRLFMIDAVIKDIKEVLK